MRKGEAKLSGKGKINSKEVIEAQLRGETTFNSIFERPGHLRKKKKNRC